MKKTRPFQFKQFVIEQQFSAMKVTLDACVFGAIVCHGRLSKPANYALDIGTGTGLLALMMAQAGITHIDGVEIDPDAAAEATANAANSPFAEQVDIHCADIEGFDPEYMYDVVISNPPFFSHSLKGPDQQRNQARHNDGLSFDNLCKKIRQLLAPSGDAWLLLPLDEMERLAATAAEVGLFPKKQWLLQSTESSSPYRSVVCFTADHQMEPVANETIIIRETDGTYTQAFSELLKPYYLKL